MTERNAAPKISLEVIFIEINGFGVIGDRVFKFLQLPASSCALEIINFVIRKKFNQFAQQRHCYLIFVKITHRISLQIFYIFYTQTFFPSKKSPTKFSPEIIF